MHMVEMSIIRMKRQVNKRKTCVEKRNKLRKSWYRDKKFLTQIEDFPNELFHEILDYLDGCEIYQSFSNLNLRFHNILSSSTLQLKINLSPFLDIDMQQNSMDIISQQRHQIISLSVMYTANIDRFFRLITLDSSFSRLESVVFMGMKSDDLLQHLSTLPSLPHLTSLTLYIDYNFQDFPEIYRLIFDLPVLKYIKLSSEVYQPVIPLPIAPNHPFSSIEYLIIHHSCCLHDLISILSYTPQLKHLACQELISSGENNIQGVTMTLSNLTYVCIPECYVGFDVLEPWIKQISSQLQAFRINTYWDANYLDAERWERLIIKSIPYLREFSFQHHELIDDDFEVTEYHRLIHRFMSSFWLRRQYIFELAIDINDWSWNEIIYSIHPYRREWYEITEIDGHCAEHNIPIEDIELTLTAPVYRECKELFTNNTITLFPSLRIIRLDIPYNRLSVGILIDLLHYLPNLDSLRIWSLSSLCVSDEQASSTHCLVLNTNKITKINIQYLTELSQLQFLLDHCPNMQYLEIGCLNNIAPKTLIRFLLTNNCRNISHLCIPPASDKIIRDLQEMIHSERLSYDETMKHLYNKIYIQWK